VRGGDGFVEAGQNTAKRYFGLYAMIYRLLLASYFLFLYECVQLPHNVPGGFNMADIPRKGRRYCEKGKVNAILT